MQQPLLSVSRSDIPKERQYAFIVPKVSCQKTAIYTFIISINKTNDAHAECVSCPNMELLESGKSDRADKVPDNFDYQMIDQKII